MKKILLILSFVCLNLIAQAQSIPDAPNPPRLVNDFAGILDAQQIASLEEQLVQFDNATSTQIVVAIVKTLDGDEASSFSVKMAQKWGIGQKGKNNGILILIKPKIDREKGQVFIAVGYGLEGVVPDAIANRIVDIEMIPRLKQNDFYGAINSAVSVIMSLTKGEFTADAYAKHKPKAKTSPKVIFLIILAIIIVIAIISSGSNNNRNNSMGKDLPFWMLMGALLGSSGSRGSSGGFGGFSSGGGDFGGFGGGGFGGGGAGGSW